MSSPSQLRKLAVLALQDVNKCPLQLREEDRVEIGAVLLFRLHCCGNPEGQANVRSKAWANVSSSWQGKYRAAIRNAMTAAPP